MNVAIETAAKDASELQGSAQVGQVNKIKMAKGKQTVQFSLSNNKQCYCCNGKAHNTQNCKFKEAVCHGCNKKGHIVKAYRTSSKPHFKKKTRSLHWTGENSEADSDGEVIISTLQVNSVENRNKAIFVAPKVVWCNFEYGIGYGFRCFCNSKG
jgi:hypothetical protein